MDIIKGNKYVCVDDDINEFDDYTMGNIYYGIDSYTLTTDGASSCVFEKEGIERCFVPYSELDKVYTKATPLLNDIFERYKGKKNRNSSKGARFFDNVGFYETGWIVASFAINESYYKDDNYTYLSESAFIEFMDLGKYIGCLNTEPNLLTTPQTTKTEVFNPKPYYNNSNGSLYKVATERGWSAYTFDVVKRLERGGKKDPLRQEIEKSIDVLKIWLNEIE